MLKYRVPDSGRQSDWKLGRHIVQKAPTGLQDIQRATRFVRFHALESHIARPDHHVSTIISSNRGGSQLDATESTTPILSGRIPLRMDSSFRRGTDILKADHPRRRGGPVRKI
jgi:hypothetical protein